MLQQIEGSKAIAHTVAGCHPEVISAYPISPQTHIVEELSRMVKAGELGHCEYVNVESEFAAMSAPTIAPLQVLEGLDAANAQIDGVVADVRNAAEAQQRAQLFRGGGGLQLRGDRVIAQHVGQLTQQAEVFI